MSWMPENEIGFLGIYSGKMIRPI